MMRFSALSVIVTMASVVSATTDAAPGASWNFNQYDGDARRIQSSTGQGELVISAGWPETALSSPKGSPLHVVEGQDGGTSLGLWGMARNGQALDVILPPSEGGTGTLSADLRRSGSGFTAVVLSISTDGGHTFKKLEAWAPTEDWAVHKAAVSIPSHSQPAVLRLTLDGATNARGGIRIDNLSIFNSVASKPAKEDSPSHSD